MKKPVLVLVLFMMSNVIIAQILFEDEATLIGINSDTGNSVHGTGVSFCDYDGDGWDDITLPSGNNKELKFFKNYDGFYVEEFLLQNQLDYPTRSVTWVDFDNDGDKDLFVTSDTNGNKLLERIADGTLKDITIEAGFIEENMFTFGVSWGDINNDGCLDLFMANRIVESTISNFLYINNCDGTFTEATNQVGLSNMPALTFCSAFFDFNNDGWQDLYVANDKFYQNLLYKNNGNGTFSDVSQTSGTDIVIDAMSVTIDDFNNDGFFDIYITNTPNIISTPTLGSVLLKNNGDETFSDVSQSTSTQLDSWCWGASFFDVENDGDLDLYVSCSYDGIDDYESFAFYRNETNGLFINDSETVFINNNYQSHSCAVGDSNKDGKIDIVVTNNNNNPNIWNNNSNAGNYLGVKLTGTSSNKDGIGSTIEMFSNGQSQYRYTLCGEGYLSQNSSVEYFGLGTYFVADYIKVKWLSGIEDILFNVPANQIINITEGSTLSMTDSNLASPIKVYPNPFMDKISVQSSIPTTSIQLFSIQGQELKFFKYSEEFLTLDLNGLESGVYFLKINHETFFEAERIVKY